MSPAEMRAINRAIRVEVQRQMRIASRRINGMVSRAIVENIADGDECQTAKMTAVADDTDDGIEVLQPAGLSSNPGAGADGVVLAVGGNTDHRVMVGAAKREVRPKDLPVGTTVLYGGTDGETKITVNPDGSIEIQAGSSGMGTVTIKGSLEVEGEVTAMTLTPATAIKLTTHKHPTALGPSGPPLPG